MSQTRPNDLAGAIERDGYATVADVLELAEVERLIVATEGLAGAGDRRRGGVRNLLGLPTVAELARSPAIRGLVAPILGAECFPVRAILFDKTPAANWKVAWHQDLAIAVRERKEVPGFTGWSDKDGVAHVLAPVNILERMLTVRLHLDPCGVDNGPLRVIPGSHRYGKLDELCTAHFRANTPEQACLMPAGGALVMRPLLLHASSAALAPAHRRVIHIEYAADPLPAGLEWSFASRLDSGMDDRPQ